MLCDLDYPPTPTVVRCVGMGLRAGGGFGGVCGAEWCRGQVVVAVLLESFFTTTLKDREAHAKRNVPPHSLSPPSSLLPPLSSLLAPRSSRSSLLSLRSPLSALLAPRSSLLSPQSPLS
eukprot:3888100-Rhodomonas_salina.1